MSGISVLALATLSTTGGLYHRKNQQSRSHEALSRSHTCVTLRTQAQEYLQIQTTHTYLFFKKCTEIYTHHTHATISHALSRPKKENYLGKLGGRNMDNYLIPP